MVVTAADLDRACDRRFLDLAIERVFPEYGSSDNFMAIKELRDRMVDSVVRVWHQMIDHAGIQFCAWSDDFICVRWYQLRKMPTARFHEMIERTQDALYPKSKLFDSVGVPLGS